MLYNKIIIILRQDFETNTQKSKCKGYLATIETMRYEWKKYNYYLF